MNNMCLTPITIDNPYYHLGGKGYLRDKKSGKIAEIGFGRYNKLHNTRDTKIQVPCGSCSQCLSNRQGFVNQRIQMESLRSHLFMLSLSYKDSELMHTNCGGYMVAYPYYKDVQNMCKRMRKDGYKFRYFFVSEYGKEKKRPHFHAIIAIEKTPGLSSSDVIYEARNLEFKYGKAFLKYWQRNYGSKRKPLYFDLCDYVVDKYGRSTYDFHYLFPIPGHDNDCSFYVSKYLYKYDDRTTKLLQKISLDPNLDEEQTKSLISKIKPRSVMSKDFGSWKLPVVQSHVNSGLDRNLDLPQFFDINTGDSMLLSPYYRNHLLPVEYKIQQYERLSIAKDFDSFELNNDDSIYDSFVSSQEAKKLDDHLKRVINLLSKRY